MLRPLASLEVEGSAWLQPFLQDFRCRFMALLPAAFRCSPRTSLPTLLICNWKWVGFELACFQLNLSGLPLPLHGAAAPPASGLLLRALACHSLAVPEMCI